MIAFIDTELPELDNSHQKCDSDFPESRKKSEENCTKIWNKWRKVVNLHRKRWRKVAKLSRNNLRKVAKPSL